LNIRVKKAKDVDAFVDMNDEPFSKHVWKTAATRTKGCADSQTTANSSFRAYSSFRGWRRDAGFNICCRGKVLSWTSLHHLGPYYVQA
jgi:hypothetical protein